MAALNFSIGEFPFLQLADYYIVAKTANGFQILLGAHDPNPILRPFAILSSIGMLEWAKILWSKSTRDLARHTKFLAATYSKVSIKRLVL